MLKLISLVTIQCFLLTASQVFLKKALLAFGKFHFSLSYFKEVFTNFNFALSGLSIAAASIIWMYVLKKFEFSVAYPLISISYVFGLLAAYFIFHETISWTRWLGVAIIMIGVVLVVQK
ncbi:MAG TPA: EamA family transporter [Bacteroidales bacterium]|jgi:undecaprenyl phosphate-alpha-L-ara4N flippase subunit ArnE|nr:EamA family transporter [Bacteroidales bacterium]HPE41037.1 EamA family transporter [Bacteroidales bacterium]